MPSRYVRAATLYSYSSIAAFPVDNMSSNAIASGTGERRKKKKKKGKRAKEKEKG